MMIRPIILFCLFLFFLPGCKEKESVPLFELMPDCGIDFVNIVEDNKLDNSFLFRNFYNGGGVAIGDIDNDGLTDVFLTANTGGNKLFLNKGNFQFEDISGKAGILKDDKWYTGAVFADINSDGWLDLYVCSSGNMSTGNRKSKLYINNKNLTFTESAAEYGLDISAYTTQVSFFDYDLDGDLDCFMINNSPIPVNQLNYANLRTLPEKEWKVGEFLKGGGDHLYRNDNGKFREVTYEAGIHGSLISFGLGVSVGDINDDGYPDVYVSNDSYEREYLYINQKDGTFKDSFEQWAEHSSMSSMGADIGDINNDGYPDIFTTDMLPDDDHRLKTTGAFDNIDLYRSKEQIGFHRQFVKNCLFLNNRDGKFLEIADYSGVPASDWSWGALFFDADNDGFTDIYVCNGVNRDVIDLDFMDFFANEVVQKMILTGKKENVDEVLRKIPRTPLANKMFRNNGNLLFTDIGNSWGFNTLTYSNGAAYADLDNDGDLDLVINNENQPAFVYKNHSREQNRNNFIGIMLKGTAGNTFAVGSKIKVYKDTSVYYRELVPSRGFQSSVDYKQIIGLGKITEVDSMVITWPDRTTSVYKNPAINKVHSLDQASQQVFNRADNIRTRDSIFTVADNSVFVKHVEDDYIDFYYERNLPVMLSQEGPAMAVADVNGDGLEDIYIGGAKASPGQLYLQTPAGFKKNTQEIFTRYADLEDVAAVFFDADKDGDADLFVGAGGNNVHPGSRELQHRLYINDGRGNFTLSIKTFPNNDMNIAVAVPLDYDGDGDMDLFVGSRSMPFNYGVIPQSYIYKNDGTGHFTDVTASLNPDIAHAGMVTGAVWTDSNGELIIAGEWMAPRVFSWTGDKFIEQKDNGLGNLYGWWQCLEAADVNGDGFTDLVIGNVGENFYLHPDEKNPAKLWINDFDNNGTREQFMTKTVNGKDMPVFLKREITDQFPGLKKANLKHSDYASKPIQALFSHEILEKTQTRLFNFSPSIIALNDGKGRFTIMPLPQQVQFSSVNAIEIRDINDDGKPDLLLGGNNFDFTPQFGRLDASFGHVLVNEGNGRFKYIRAGESGILAEGEIKGIATIQSTTNRPYFIWVRNDRQPLLYRKK